AGRTDLVDQESKELAILQAYMPAQLSAAEVQSAIQKVIADLGASGPQDMGKVIGALKAQLAGKADMGMVSGLVKAALAK
ncbi:MAG: GatB/YqeY domain-containing protein, partial [Burkholderiaceae bacterium]|nr:GatB/YqeY domain-containing protein [Burkholderiaceae bacterium]